MLKDFLLLTLQTSQNLEKTHFFLVAVDAFDIIDNKIIWFLNMLQKWWNILLLFMLLTTSKSFFFEICFKNAKRLIAFGAVDTIPNKEILCLKYALKML